MTSPVVLVVDKIFTGARLIARKLDTSESTVLRMIKSKELNAFKLRPGNSPWKVTRSELDRVKARRGG